MRTQSISRVDDEEKDGQSSSMPDSGFTIDNMGLVDMAIVKACKDLLGSECLRCANSRNNFFRDTSSRCNMLERKP